MRPKKSKVDLSEVRSLSWATYLGGVMQGVDNPRHANSIDPETAIRAALGSVAGVSAIESVVNAAILQGFADERDSTAGWVRVVELPNYLRGQLAIVDEPPRLGQIPRGGSAPVANFGVSAEGWQLANFGGQFALTEEDLLDGQPLGLDLVAIEQLGRAARRLVLDLVYSVLLENAVMADGVALFDAARGNLATAALADTALDAAIGAVVNQVQTDEDGDPVHRGLSPRYLLVPGQLVGLARRLVAAMDTGDDNGLIVRAESRLSAAGLVDPRGKETLRAGSATNWLLTCPAEQAAGVVVGALGGSLTPRIRSGELTGGEWGMWWDVSLPLACAALDSQAMYWSTGAA